MRASSDRFEQFVEVANGRAKELPTRLSIGVFLGLSAWFITGSLLWMPWLLLVLAGQAFDWVAMRPLRHAVEPDDVRPRLFGVAAFSVFLNATIYTGVSAIIWYAGGEAGRIFAIMVICGALLHSTLHSARSPLLLASSIGPMCTYLIGMPVVSAVFHDLPWATSAAIVIGAFLYLGHLAIIVLRFNQAYDAMAGANEEILVQKQRAEAAAANLETRVRERTEELEIAKKEAEAANLAKSQFIANMSHELRTPLNAIIGYTEMLNETAVDDGRSEDVDDSRRVLSAAHRLLKLINEILDFSKIEAGRMLIETSDFQVDSLLEEVASTVRPGIETNRNIFEIQRHADLGVACSDAFKASQCLINLLSNAGKFTEDGTVRLDATRFQDADGEWLRFVVSDTGIGMSDEELEKVFQPFTQADTSTTRAYGGTGLGLCITRSLTELLGGTLTVSSAEGRGTSFTLKMPVLHPEVELPLRPEANGIQSAA